VLADPAVGVVDLGVGEAGVGLRDRDELAFAPDAERVVRQESRAPSVPGLRVDQDGVDRVGLDLPLPPVAALSAGAIRRRAALEDEALDASLARLLAERSKLLPAPGHVLGEREGRDLLEARAPLGERLAA